MRLLLIIGMATHRFTITDMSSKSSYIMLHDILSAVASSRRMAYLRKRWPARRLITKVNKIESHAVLADFTISGLILR